MTKRIDFDCVLADILVNGGMEECPADCEETENCEACPLFRGESLQDDESYPDDYCPWCGESENYGCLCRYDGFGPGVHMPI